MTPKEKAKQLCDAFYQKLPLEMYVTTTDGDLSWEYSSWKNAKECALIAVGELLILAGFYDKKVWDYLEEVKQEIEKL